MGAARHRRTEDARHCRVVVAAALTLALAAGCREREASAEGRPAARAETGLRAVSDGAPRTSAASNPAGWPPVEFQPPELGFGVVEPESTVRGRSRIWNVGKTPLRIWRSITSCGCTSAEDLSGRVIAPGGFIEFETSMKIKSGLGEKKEKVTVFFEGYEGGPGPEDDLRYAPVFYFTAEASRAVRAVPPHITATNGLQGEFVLESRDRKPFRVLASQGGPPVLVGHDPVGPPANRYTLRWDLTREDQAGSVPWFWIIETDHPDAPIVDLRIRHEATKPDHTKRPWVAKDQRVVIDRVKPGEPVEFVAQIEYHPGQIPAPRTAAIGGSPSELTAELVEAVQEGQLVNYRIRVRARPGPSVLFQEEISLQASGASAPLRIIGRRLG
jgi:hypothetical protein